jgi:hypothetical protein
MDAQHIIVAMVAGCAFLLFVALRRRRDAVLDKVRYGLQIAIAFVLTFVIASRFLPAPQPIYLAFIAELVVGLYFRPRRRSRYIPKTERRKAIARFERSGQRYDPKKHEIDHVVPYSRGGVSKADNLRVIARDRNRAKAARSPWWDVLGR